MTAAIAPIPGHIGRRRLHLFCAFTWVFSCLVVGQTSSALAFHSAMLFPDDASVGGGGGLFYNGSPRHKGYTCATCHLKPPGLASLDFTSQPPSLADDGVYQPDQVYKVSVRLEGESRGLNSKSNYNTFSVEVLDGRAAPVGVFEDFFAGGMVSTMDRDALFARARDDVVATSWFFDWQAPAAGTGEVTFYLAGVDGDGAGATEQAATDPLGDDVMVLRLHAYEEGQSRPDEAVEAACSASARVPRGAAGATFVLLVGLVFCLLGVRSRCRL